MMQCNDFEYDDDGRRQDCTAEATGKHGLCAKHVARRIQYIKKSIAQVERYIRFCLDDAKAHKRFVHRRNHSIARVRDARSYGHQALRLKRELRMLEAAK